MIDLFEKTVSPILLYGCEVWGFENSTVIETVQLKFYKYLLGLKKSTPSYIVYGELGVYPLDISIKVRMVSYWLKLIQCVNKRFNKKFYNTLYLLFRWLLYIKMVNVYL